MVSIFVMKIETGVGRKIVRRRKTEAPNSVQELQRETPEVDFVAAFDLAPAAPL